MIDVKNHNDVQFSPFYRGQRRSVGLCMRGVRLILVDKIKEKLTNLSENCLLISFTKISEKNYIGKIPPTLSLVFRQCPLLNGKNHESL